MKLSKILALALACVLSAGIMFGCVSDDGAEGGSAASDVTEITIYNNKVEIDEALKAFAATYEAETGVRVNVRTAGGDVSYSVSLKADMQGGTEPEIFVLEGPSGFADYNDRLTDLSDQPWVEDTTLEYIHEGKVMGFPVSIEGYGLAYNMAVLEQAEIDPATLVNYAAVEAAFAKIDSMKDELGLDAVISFPASGGMTWVTGLHNWNTYLTNGLAYDDYSVADLMMNGEVDEDRLAAYARYVNMLFKYSDQRVLLAGTYDDQINAFVQQKTAFIHQGNWAEPNLYGAGMDFDVAFAPHPYLDEDTDGIFVAAPSWYVVNNLAPNADAAKDFLAYLASNPNGHDYMVNQAGMVPAFDSVELLPSGQLSQSMLEWVAAGKIYNWQQYRMPDGFGMDTLGPIFTQLANGDIDEAEFCARIAAEVATLKQ